MVSTQYHHQFQAHTCVIYSTCQNVFNCYFDADLSVGKKLQLPSFRETLKERGTVQMLTLARDAALEVQVCFGLTVTD